MTIVLPGVGADIGSALASIGDTVSKIIDPNWQVKQAVKQKVISDPTYAQSLADMEYLNPGYLDKSGLGGRIGETIARIQPSGAAQYEKEFGPQERADQAALKHTQELAAEAGLQLDQANLEEAGMRITAMKQEVADSDALNSLPIFKVGDQMVQGQKPSDEDMTAIRANPLALKKLSDYVAMQLGIKDSNSRNTATERQLVISNRQLRIQEGQNDMFYRNLASQYQKANPLAGVTADDWQSYLSDPNTKLLADGLVSNPQNAKTPQEQRLLKIAQAMSNNEQLNNADDIAGKRKDIADQIQRINIAGNGPNANVNNAQALTTPLAVTLRQLARASGIDEVSAKYTNAGKGGYMLRYYQNGKEITEDTAVSILDQMLSSATSQALSTKPTTALNELSPENQQVVRDNATSIIQSIQGGSTLETELQKIQNDPATANMYPYLYDYFHRTTSP